MFMNKNLVRPVGSTRQDNLIAKLEPPAATMGVVIPAGTGLLARGTVLAWDGSTFSVLGDGSGTANCVLADPVDASGENDAAGVAYFCGNFNKDALIVSEGYTITPEDTDKLRTYNIILTEVM